MAVYVIDEIMGRGKTSALINHINQSDPATRYLFITPYLTETKRIMEACENRIFFDPDEKGGKLNNIKVLLERNYNIVSTHALFKSFDDQVFELLETRHYTLIMDETMATAEKMSVSYRDANMIMDQLVEVDDNKLIVWTDQEYVGKFEDYKRRIDKGTVYAYSRFYWVYMMESKMFDLFDDVYVMTYMFQDQVQRCYFDYYDIKYKFKYIAGNSLETYRLSDEKDPLPPIDLKSLIHIEDDPELNSIGWGWSDLSKSWYIEHLPHENTYEARTLRKNIGIFCRKHKAKSRDVLWTCFKGGKDDSGKMLPDWKHILSSDGYRRGFLSCNAKGTNKYRKRTVLVYLTNRYPDPNLYNFLTANGIEWNREFYALQEMLQWIWRSAIRDGHEIWIYIPSRRMRTLLEQWLDRLAEGGDAG